MATDGNPVSILDLGESDARVAGVVLASLGLVLVLLQITQETYKVLPPATV